MNNRNDYNRQINLGAAAGTVGVALLVVVAVLLFLIALSSPYGVMMIAFAMMCSPLVLVPLGIYWMIRDSR